MCKETQILFLFSLNENKIKMNTNHFKPGPHILFASCAFITAIIAIFFIGVVFYIAYPTFVSQGFINFLSGTRWNYDEGTYGIRIFINGTIILTFVTLIIAVPIGVFSAIFLSELAHRRIASIVRPLIELLVGIPSVVYGIVGLYLLEGIIRNHFEPLVVSLLGFVPVFQDNTMNSGSGLALASIVLAIMILPTIISFSEDAMRAVKREYRDASFALGATKWETINKVVLPLSYKGIMAGIILGMMRAMGETMAVVMLFGCVQSTPTSIFSYGFAMTSKILCDIGFYVAFDEPRSALFAIAAVLFAMEILFVGIAKLIGGRI